MCETNKTNTHTHTYQEYGDATAVLNYLCIIQKMIAALSAIIISIGAGITLFIQTITLSSCRRLQCCCGKCELGEVREPNDLRDL
jgi:hypothetical protein